MATEGLDLVRRAGLSDTYRQRGWEAGGLEVLWQILNTSVKVGTDLVSRAPQNTQLKCQNWRLSCNPEKTQGLRIRTFS